MSLLSVVRLTALLTAMGLLQPDAAGSRPGSSLGTVPADTCPTVEFEGRVAHGASWERALGGRLVFTLAPNHDATLPGWSIEIRSPDLAEPENELTWVVTPPYRSWNPLYLDVSYALTARESVARDVREFGIVHPADYTRAAEAVRTLLWPYGKTDRALAEAEQVLASARQGRGVLRIINAEIADTPDGRGRIERLDFAVTLCLP